MPDTTDAQSQATPAARAAGASGCVIFLIDESTAMDARVAAGTKSKAESIATALNSLLSQLTTGPAIEVAIVGYRATQQGDDNIGPRWGGALAGRGFVPSSELADAPLTVETRVRKVPGSGGIGVTREETVQFPIWYAPTLGGSASRMAAFEHCRDMLSGWLSAAGTNPKPPMLVSFLGELAAQESPEALGKVVQELETPGGPPLVVQAHLSSSERIPATLYPSSDAHLPPGPVRLFFQASSVLPEAFCASLRELAVTVNAGARGLIYNAKMADLIRLLSLVKAYAQHEPPALAAPPSPAAALGPAAEEPAADTLGATGEAASIAAPEHSITIAPAGDATVTDLLRAALGPTAKGPAPDSATVEMPAADAPTVQIPAAEAPLTAGTSPEAGTDEATQADETGEAPSAGEGVASAARQRALIVFLLDRSVQDPNAEEEKTVWQRLQEHANELLAQISKRGGGRIDCAVVSYGTGASGQTKVTTTFSGPLAGRALVPDTDLAAGALRVEELTQQVSNGIGGLVSVTRKRPVFVDLKPTAAGVPSAALAALSGLLAEWRQRHALSRFAPLVLHMTRGRFDPRDVEQAVGQLREAGPLVLYHLVLTESPHPSVAYPAQPDRIEDPALMRLWELTSPLLGRETLAARKAAVLPDSRGMVINGKFDLFLDAIEEALSTCEAGPAHTAGEPS